MTGGVVLAFIIFKSRGGGGGTTDQLQKSSFSAIVHLSLHYWKTFFSLAFQCIIVIHLTIASVVSLVAVSNNNNEQVQFSSFQKGAGA